MNDSLWLDEEEREILQAFEAGALVEVDDASAVKARHQAYAADFLSQVYSTASSLAVIRITNPPNQSTP
jgi:hypothetical protein